jgi:acyl dehydratase
MTVSLAGLPKGHEFAPKTLKLKPEWVAEYRAAVADENTPSSIVPPLALATLTLRSLLEQAALPRGAIHVSQELISFKAVKPGDAVVAKARIGSKGERAGWVLLAVELEVAEEAGDTVTSGRATITFPAVAEVVE